MMGQTSILCFVEDNWLGGAHIGDGLDDALAGPLTGMFDFKHGPRTQRLFLDPSTGEATNPVKITPGPTPSYSVYPRPPPSPSPEPSYTLPPGTDLGTPSLPKLV
jgi:hypothetical protein